MGALAVELHQLQMLEGLVETVVPAAVAAADMGTKAQTEVAMVLMGGILRALHLLVLDRALLPASLEKQRGDCTPEVAVAVADIFPVEQEVPAVGETAQQIRHTRMLPVEPTTLEAVVEETLVEATAQTAAAASCAFGCTRRARKRGKDNYAVIQERNEDGGSKSTAL